MTYWPINPDLDEVELGKQLRCLTGIAAVYCGSASPLVLTLRRAESDATALGEAAAMVERMPTHTRRRMLSTFGAVTRPRSSRRGGRNAGS